MWHGGLQGGISRYRHIWEVGRWAFNERRPNFQQCFVHHFVHHQRGNCIMKYCRSPNTSNNKFHRGILFDFSFGVVMHCYHILEVRWVCSISKAMVNHFVRIMKHMSPSEPNPFCEQAFIAICKTQVYRHKLCHTTNKSLPSQYISSVTWMMMSRHVLTMWVPLLYRANKQMTVILSKILEKQFYIKIYFWWFFEYFLGVYGVIHSTIVRLKLYYMTCILLYV